MTGTLQATPLSAQQFFERLKDPLELRAYKSRQTDDTDLAKICQVFIGLERLNLSGSPITDRGTLLIGRLINLTFLDLSDTPVGSRTFKQLKQLKHLQKLNLAGTKLTHLSDIACHQKLVELNVSRTPLIHTEACYIQCFKKVELLKINDLAHSDLIRHLPYLSQLRHLEVQNYFTIQDPLKPLMHCQKLEVVNISGCQYMNFASLLPLIKVKTLQRIIANDCGDEVVAELNEIHRILRGRLISSDDQTQLSWLRN